MGSSSSSLFLEPDCSIPPYEQVASVHSHALDALDCLAMHSILWQPIGFGHSIIFVAMFILGSREEQDVVSGVFGLVVVVCTLVPIL